MFHNLKNKESGVVLVTVIILTIIMMIVTIGVISTNYSQSIYSHHQVDRIRAEQIAKGVAWHNYINLSFNLDSSSLPSEQVLDGKRFSINLVETGTDLDGTINYDIDVTY